MTAFSQITTLDGWKTKLQELLDQGRAASDSNDADTLLRVCRDLLKYIEKSSPAIAGTDALDDIAIQAHQRLSAEVVDDALDDIRRRTADIVALRKSIERVASEAEAAAAANRLTLAHAAIDTLTQAVRAVEKLNSVLAHGADDDLRTTLQALVAALEKGQASIRKKG